MRDALLCIGERMRKIVHRIDTPLVARAVMGDVRNAVDDRIAHIEIRRAHIDFCPQDARAVLEFTGSHAAKQVKIFLHRAIAVGALFARLSERAAVCANFICRQVVHIGLAQFDQAHGTFIDKIEIVGGIVEVIPLKAEPLDVLQNRIDILRILFYGVGIVEAEIAFAAVFHSGGEIDADRLGMADVQIAVRLRGEARLHMVVDAVL